MENIIWSLQSIDAFTVYILAALIAAVVWFIREIVGSTMLAVVALPFLAIGGLTSHFVFQAFPASLIYDKDSNVVVSTAIGILAALIAVLIAAWALARLAEYRMRRRPVEGANSTTARAK
jgi:hypothetical protein